MKNSGTMMLKNFARVGFEKIPLSTMFRHRLVKIAFLSLNVSQNLQ